MKQLVIKPWDGFCGPLEVRTHPLPPPDSGASFSSFGCFVFEVWVLRSSFSSASVSKLPTNVLFSSVIPAKGTRQINKTFMKGLLTIQDQEYFKTHNKRKLRQQ